MKIEKTKFGFKKASWFKRHEMLTVTLVSLLFWTVTVLLWAFPL